MYIYYFVVIAYILYWKLKKLGSALKLKSGPLKSWVGVYQTVRVEFVE